MKILLFGKHGQLGWELQRSLAPLGELVALGRQAETHPLFPGTPLHGNFLQLDALAETVRAAYAAVLGCPVDSADADFFQLGGHSLIAMSLLSQLSKSLSVAVGIEDVMGYPARAPLPFTLAAWQRRM